MTNVLRFPPRRPARPPIVVDHVRLWEGRGVFCFGVDIVLDSGRHVTMGHWPDHDSALAHARTLVRDHGVEIREVRP